MQKGRKSPSLSDTRALLRAMGTVIKQADDLGENELVDVMAAFIVNIATKASLQRERERLRDEAIRRLRRRRPRTPAIQNARKRRLGRQKLYLVKGTPDESD